MSATSMGWRDILRPIRDGLRDNLPEHHRKDQDRDHDEQLKSRHQDSVRGFAYFETFDELEHWREEHVDPLQRSNTPLLRRPQTHRSDGKASLTVIHDQAGGYHAYEAIQGAVVDRQQYYGAYLALIDRFIYFSHKVGRSMMPSIKLAEVGISSLSAYHPLLGLTLSIGTVSCH